MISPKCKAELHLCATILLHAWFCEVMNAAWEESSKSYAAEALVILVRVWDRIRRLIFDLLGLDFLLLGGAMLSHWSPITVRSPVEYQSLSSVQPSSLSLWTANSASFFSTAESPFTGVEHFVLRILILSRLRFLYVWSSHCLFG